MQHGRKSAQSRFDGYKLSAAVSNTSEPLIMTVHVAPGGESDGPQAKHLIDSQPPERRPNRILGDTAYGNGVVRSELAERNVRYSHLSRRAPSRRTGSASATSRSIRLSERSPARPATPRRSLPRRRACEPRGSRERYAATAR